MNHTEHATTTTTAVSAVDRLLKTAMDRFTAHGPPLQDRLLGPLRDAAATRAFASRRHLTAPSNAPIESHPRPLFVNESQSQTELATLAENALANMRAEVRKASRKDGPQTWLLTRADSLWVDCQTEEFMDDPQFDPARRTRIMKVLDQFNTNFGTYERFFDAIAPLARPRGVTTVLDLASGHAGFVCAAAGYARQRRLNIQFTASDLKKEYLEIGRQRAASTGMAVDFVEQNALDLSNVPAGGYDIITCTQSLHHFSPGMVAVMFSAAVRAAARGVVFIDGCRSPLAGISGLLYGVLRMGSIDWSHDAWISARKCFVPEELRLLARLAHPGGHIESHWIPPGYCLLRSQVAE